MKKVIIIGCGYGGAVCAWRLCAFRKQLEVTVIDKGGNFNFLPLLPDSIGRKIPPENLAYPIERLARGYGFNFLKQEVTSLDLPKRTLQAGGQTLDFDYLVIASGSETNFYGNEAVRKYAYKLDDASDARKINQALEREDFSRYIICGGGYTGIELVTNLRRRLKETKDILIVERAPEILALLPGWMKEYVADNLSKLKIEVLTNSVITGAEGRKVTISGGKEFSDSMLIWAAGVKAAPFLQGLQVEKNPQGRVKVDEFLRLSENCFVIGDSAWFSHGGSFLRMAVQFAIAQANTAAGNIIRSIKGVKLEKFRPFDLGYIIPMANNQSCGSVLGVNVRGRAATALHYLISTWRSPGWRNKLGITSALLKGGRR